MLKNKQVTPNYSLNNAIWELFCAKMETSKAIDLISEQILAFLTVYY